MISDSVYTLIDIAVTCLEVFFLIYLMRNEDRRGGILSLFTFAVIEVAAILIMTKNGIPILIKYFIEILFIAVSGRLVYRCGIVKLLLYGIIFVLCVHCSEIIVLYIWNMFKEPVVSDNVIYKEFTLSLVILAKAAHFLLIAIFERIMRRNKSGRGLKELVPVIALGIPFLLVLEGISINLPAITDEKNVLFSISSSAIILGVFLYIIIFNDHYLEVRQEVQREETALYELQLKYDYYQKKREDEELIKEIYHDMKHHILLAEGTISKGVIEKLSRYENYYDTGNEFLNVIIADKLEKAREKEIQLECDINVRGYDFIAPIDISTIFGNILDNALEACELLSGDERIIFLNVLSRGGILYIVLKNRMINQRMNISKKIITNKNNRSLHGFGISNVKKAVKAYNGECKIAAENNEFVISIVIPVPEEKWRERRQAGGGIL